MYLSAQSHLFLALSFLSLCPISNFLTFWVSFISSHFKDMKHRFEPEVRNIVQVDEGWTKELCSKVLHSVEILLHGRACLPQDVVTVRQRPTLTAVLIYQQVFNIWLTEATALNTIWTEPSITKPHNQDPKTKIWLGASHCSMRNMDIPMACEYCYDCFLQTTSIKEPEQMEPHLSNSWASSLCTRNAQWA